MDIEKTVKEIIAEQLDQKLKDIRLRNNITKDFKADSLDIVELVMAVEEKFTIQIEDEDAEKILTVKDLVNYVKRHLKKDSS